jgi:hypothetical protein
MVPNGTVGGLNSKGPIPLFVVFHCKVREVFAILFAGLAVVYRQCLDSLIPQAKVCPGFREVWVEFDERHENNPTIDQCG